MTFKHTLIEREIPDEVRKWIEEETAEQVERYNKIVAEMSDLDATRDQWYAEFFDRIQTMGFNEDGDRRVKIAEADLPVKPDGEHKVVF